VLKHNITTTTSRCARRVVFAFFSLCAMVFVLLWGASWLSALLLVLYYGALFGLLRSLQLNTFSCEIGKETHIEVLQPKFLVGHISGRSFYNTMFMMLCVTASDSLHIGQPHQHNNEKHWFVVFSDSVPQQDYRLLARLIVGARWA